MKVRGWFVERHTPYVALAIRIKERLYSGKSNFQKIEVVDSYEFGRILLLDGLVMITERDEYAYHEMITHVPLMVHPNAQHVLVIGAGDGGTIRELTKHSQVKRIEQVEIDQMVIEVARRFFPTVASKYGDSRVNVNIADGFDYVKDKQGEFDLIIVDSTDPQGPGKILFSPTFYRRVFKALRPDGIMTAQVGSPFYDYRHVRRSLRKMKRVFPIVKPYMVHIPTYTDGYYCMAFCSKKYDPIGDFLPRRAKKLRLTTKYYNDAVHCGAFMLPNYVPRPDH